MSDNAAQSSDGPVIEVGTRVVMSKDHRWQGVGSVSRVHDNALTCAVKWDSGRLDRSIKLADLIVKKPPGASTVDTESSGSPQKSPPSKAEVRKDLNNSDTEDGAAPRTLPEPVDEPKRDQSATASAHQDEPGAAPSAPLFTPPAATHDAPVGSSSRPLLWAAAGAVGGIALAAAGMAMYIHRDALAKHLQTLREQLAADSSKAAA